MGPRKSRSRAVCLPDAANRREVRNQARRHNPRNAAWRRPRLRTSGGRRPCGANAWNFYVQSLS